MMEKSCCFSGHRRLLKDEKYIKDTVNAAIQRMYSMGVRRFLTGGALGFDTLCAKEVLSMKKRYEDIELLLILPCKDQDKYWTKSQKEEYRNLIDCADEVVYIGEKYIPGCMHARNRYMVDNSKYLVAYCEKTTGGTYYTLEYAYQKNKVVTNVAAICEK